jgi:hypothetical protein
MVAAGAQETHLKEFCAWCDEGLRPLSARRGALASPLL